MAKLKVESFGAKKYNFKKVAKAVYNQLGQTAKLKLELSFVTEEEIKRLNREFRNIDAVTDVLSFPTLDGVRGTIITAQDFPMDITGGRVMLGSIAICEKRAEEQAVTYGHSKEREIYYLALHGMLHLFGYDHMTEEDKLQMRTIEKIIVKELAIAEEE